MESIPKLGAIISKILIWNRTGTESYDDTSECKITFNNKQTLRFECEQVDELEKENRGIYELQSDGTYKQIEDWEN